MKGLCLDVELIGVQQVIDEDAAGVAEDATTDKNNYA